VLSSLPKIHPQWWTNGKGSTIAFIDNIYQQANIKVAKFTSPHILRYNERFVINGVQASDKSFLGNLANHPVFQECSLVFPKFTLNGVIVFHCFTSPHILRYNERFVINGVQASDKKICTAFKTIEQARSNTALTYFEFSTLAWWV
jgi:folylpolyglutamate synthase/dihydropteroate synthase